MGKYLYGASIQGIQNFILQTNELKDIVGASELVNNICEEAFAEFEVKNENSILRAAGNIRHIFDKKEDCENAVRKFPKKVMEMAPGITISQAVVKVETDSFKAAIDEIENRLKIQRNKQLPTNLGLIGMQRARNTGLPLVAAKEGEYLDLATKAKRKQATAGNENSTKLLCKKCFGFDVVHNKVAYDIEKITKKNDWIAIIHADGNGLGQVVQKIGGDEANFKKFSQELNNATIEAAIKAYNFVADKYKFNEESIIPIRPIVLGGDDLTIICRADFAIDYTREFLNAFETLTNEKLGSMLQEEKVFNSEEYKLTACAGISFIKSSFPFYYGYELAEELCKVAKEDAKKGLADGHLPASCLMFHKVQDSFVVDFKDIVERELKPQENISFKNGPYYINSNNNNEKKIEKLLEDIKMLTTKEGNAVKSHLRQWMTLLHDNPAAAKQKIKRLKSILNNKETGEAIKLKGFVNKVTEGRKDNGITIYPVYDILSMHSIIHQDTKSKTKEE